MSTDKLINSLCDNLEPVKPMKHPLLRAYPWLAFATLYAITASLMIGVRPDLSSKLSDSTFLFEIGIATSLGISAFLASFWAEIPDQRGQKWILTIPFTITFIFILWTLCRMAGEDTHMIEAFSWHECFTKGVLLGTVPIAALTALQRHSATTCAVTSALLNILGAGAVGFIALRFTCIDDSVEHTVLHHIAPFITSGFFLGLIVRRFYKW